ncbi:hypothetical protein IB232_05790 [Pseudomonas sp. PDM15]|jgi:hypothetical protein|uniref:hypothetical protein n=1 Tax=Pseudomonas sp. PDM15 TaxID=2769303 RepID=UPI001785A6B6|nr:hypothetical protein [Pseudomonas sp. PDM15]MBD9424826.1 hypothetical protein [Pseudomonas sp. PDM15]
MDRAAPAPRSKLKVALSLLLLLAATALAYAQWQALPHFAEMFAMFGPDMPGFSVWVVGHPQRVGICLGSLLAYNMTWLALWLFLRQRWSSIGLSLATALTWLFLALVMIAFYLPLLTIAV